MKIFFNKIIYYFWLKKWLFLQQIETIRLYYRRSQFALADVLIGLSSICFNPYRACRKFFEKKGSQNGIYGETPLRVFEQIAKAVCLQSHDVYAELGSGRGKTCFWAAGFCGCQVVGIECVPSLVRLARFVSWMTRLEIEFQKKSVFEADLSEATVVYVSAIHFSEEEMDQLRAACRRMPKGGRLITISEPLQCELFSVEQCLEVEYPWGQTEVFINRRD